MTLGELLSEVAADLPGIDVASSADGSITWSRAGRPFAILAVGGATAEFALDDAIAAAATRTPDVVPSSRGAGWVAFSPDLVDDHAADRAEAWFASGHRRLGPRD
jgi:hypothetical protein